MTRHLVPDNPANKPLTNDQEPLAQAHRHPANHGATIKTATRPRCAIHVRTANDADIGTVSGGEHSGSRRVTLALMSSNWPAGSSFLCRHCGTYSLSETIATECRTEVSEDETSETYPEYRYRLVRCTVCADLSLLLAMRIVWGNGDLDYEGESTVYPAPPRSLSAGIPNSLQRCFQEARACYQARAYIASAIMCRRALELLAVERGVKVQDLAQSLAKLKEQGDIDQRLYDWCDALRLAGNQAAHDVGQA